MNIIAPGGHFAAIGVSEAPLSQLTMVIKGLTLYGIGGVKVQETIDLIASGRLDMPDAVGHRYPFSQLKEALEFKLGTPGAEGGRRLRRREPHAVTPSSRTKAAA